MKVHTTHNATWFPRSPPNGKPGSERMTLYSMIAERPGISTDELQDAWPHKLSKASLRSRLTELLDKHYVELRRPSDLFAKEPK